MADSDTNAGKRSDRRFRTPGGRCEVCRKSKKGSCGTPQSTLRCLRRKEEGLPYVTADGVKILPKGWSEQTASALYVPAEPQNVAELQQQQQQQQQPDGFNTKMGPIQDVHPHLAGCYPNGYPMPPKGTEKHPTLLAPIALTHPAFLAPGVDLSGTAHLLAHLSTVSNAHILHHAFVTHDTLSASQQQQHPHHAQQPQQVQPFQVQQAHVQQQQQEGKMLHADQQARQGDSDTPRGKNKIPENRRCQHENCKKWAKYSKTGERLFCKSHMKERGLNPIEVERKPCKHDGCNKEAKTSTEGTTMYCISHMRQYGLQPRIRLCTHPGCSKGAKTSTDSLRLYCRAHMKEYGMTSVKSHCKHPGCLKAAAADNEGHWQYCVSHIREQGMQPRPTHLRYPPGRTPHTSSGRTPGTPNTVSMEEDEEEGGLGGQGMPEVQSQSRRPPMLAPLNVAGYPLAGPLSRGGPPTCLSDGATSESSMDLKHGLSMVPITAGSNARIRTMPAGAHPLLKPLATRGGLNPEALGARSHLEVPHMGPPGGQSDRRGVSLDGSSASSGLDLPMEFGGGGRHGGEHGMGPAGVPAGVVVYGVQPAAAMESTSVSPQSMQGGEAGLARHVLPGQGGGRPAGSRGGRHLPAVPLPKVRLFPWQMCQVPDCTNRAAAGCPGHYCPKHLRSRTGGPPRKPGEWVCFASGCLPAESADSWQDCAVPSPTSGSHPLAHYGIQPLQTPFQLPPGTELPPLPVISISVLSNSHPPRPEPPHFEQSSGSGSASASLPHPQPSPNLPALSPQLSTVSTQLPASITPGTSPYPRFTSLPTSPTSAPSLSFQHTKPTTTKAPFCAHPDCERRTVAHDGQRLPYCAVHCEQYSLDLGRALCQHGSCVRAAVALRDPDGPRLYCLIHMKDHATSIPLPRCLQLGCRRILPPQCESRYCVRHQVAAPVEAEGSGGTGDGHSSEGGGDTPRSQAARTDLTLASRRGTNKRKGSRPEAAVPAGQAKPSPAAVAAAQREQQRQRSVEREKAEKAETSVERERPATRGLTRASAIATERRGGRRRGREPEKAAEQEQPKRQRPAGSQQGPDAFLKPPKRQRS